MSRENTSEGLTFSFSDILKTLWLKKWIVALIMVVCVGASLIYAWFLQPPKYVSSAKIIVINTSDTGTLTSSEIAIATYLVSDYAQLIVDRTVLEEVGKELSPKLSYEQVKRKVSVSVPENSRIVEIKVTTDNPEYSKQIADKICDVAKVKILELLGVDKVNQFGPASLPRNSAHKAETLATLGILAGVFLSAVFAIFCIYTNDKIDTEEDIEKYLDICILAHIPYNGKKTSGSKSRKAAKR